MIAKLKASLLFFSLFVVAGCVTAGPNSEVKSKAGYLNGENYNVPQGIVPGAGIPVGYWGQINNRTTTISGTVFHKSDSMLFPLGHQTVQLKNKKGEVLQEVQSDGGGVFTIAGPIPNGEYLLEVLNKRYRGSLNLDVKTHEIKNLKLQAHEQKK